MKISNEEMDNIVCAAIEGGIGYWCHRLEPIDASGNPTTYMGEACEEIRRGGRLRLYLREESGSRILDRENFTAGAEKFAKKNPKYLYKGSDGQMHLNDFDIDAEAADIIIQLAVFQELRYG